MRLADNPALHAALKQADQVIPVYIHSPEEEAPWQSGEASNWWLHHSLNELQQSLVNLGSRLVIRQGHAREVLQSLLAETSATQVYWNRLYDPVLIKRDEAIKSWLKSAEIVCQSYNASLLFEPWQIKTLSETPYRVFTPFWKNCSKQLDTISVLDSPKTLSEVPAIDSLKIDDLHLLAKINWYEQFAEYWQPGEAGAFLQLEENVENLFLHYKEGRDYPAHADTSLLSPHLHFGEVSPRQIVEYCQSQSLLQTKANALANHEAFIRQLGWRDFAYHLLYHFPETTEKPLNSKFENFPWQPDEKSIQAWQQGKTGIPIIDAGMRQLWQTGWMHNRVRMLVGSLLTKNLLSPWQTGARWFWDTLVDADLANNTLGWQWIAGCGADAAPYFRIFNPVTQSQRYDPDGDYIKKWVPELEPVEPKWVHSPWMFSEQLAKNYDIVVGKDYPQPIVDLKLSREQALQAYQQIK